VQIGKRKKRLGGRPQPGNADADADADALIAVTTTVVAAAAAVAALAERSCHIAPRRHHASAFSPQIARLIAALSLEFRLSQHE
jgi:hypothetical protein